MILVVGATGDLGSEVCQRLRDAGMPVRGLVRATADETKLERLRQMGVELAYGDLKNRDSLVAAVQDVDTVMTTATTTISRQPDDSIEATDRDGCLDLVAAAKAAGVGQFIYTSYSRNIQSGTDPCALTHAKRSLESAMQSSGMTYTILRPSYYMEVWLSPIVGFDYLNASATIYGAGKTPVSWISRSDVAAFAVASLDNAHARNATLELGGPEALSPLEVVSIFESVGGRPFEVNHVPVEALQEQKQGAQDSVQEAFAALMLTHEAGDAIDMEETAEKFAIDLTSVREYAESVMETEAGGAA
jgi:uncharacterized protein YbjT (DUF2867 family)